MAIQVYLCDDVPALRLVLRTVLELGGDVEIVGESGDGKTALEEVGRLRPDVLVLDLSLPGLEVLEALDTYSPETRVVVFSGYPERQLGEAARLRGARRYVEKGADIELVVRYVREVALEAA